MARSNFLRWRLGMLGALAISPLLGCGKSSGFADLARQTAETTANRKPPKEEYSKISWGAPRRPRTSSSSSGPPVTGPSTAPRRDGADLLQSPASPNPTEAMAPDPNRAAPSLVDGPPRTSLDALPGNTAAASDPASPNASSNSLPQMEERVRLLRGVALPQSLPTGTAMGFQVEYVFPGGPRPGTQYIWVIKPPRGETQSQPVQLQATGALSTFVLPWGPVAGTYETHLEAVTRQGRRVISDTLDLNYSQ